MKTYISDIIPRLGRFSKELADVTLLTDQHWVSLDVAVGQKRTYIFRRNNELLVSLNGQVEKGKWDIIGKDSLLLDVGKNSYLLRHGFFDENILALKLDSKDEYAIFVNESKFGRELNSVEAIDDFLNDQYIEPITPATSPLKINVDSEPLPITFNRQSAGLITILFFLIILIVLFAVFRLE